MLARGRPPLWVASLAALAGCAGDLGTPRSSEPGPGAETTADASHDATADAAPADAEAAPSPPAAIEAPPGAKVTLEPVKRRFFLGECLRVHYGVTNEGKRPFSVSAGSDYRGSSRHLRFGVSARDAEGRELEDPDPSGFCLGGLGSSPVLAPGKSFFQTIDLGRYRRFEKAGRYRIRVAHDLGWSEGGDGVMAWEEMAEDDPRWAEAEIELVMPDARQAEEVVRAMAALPDDPNATFGQKTAPFADFTCLRYPVYLPILERRAKAGPDAARAIAGIEQIPTPEATAALLRLAQGCPAGDECTEAARGALMMRLPDPQLAGELPPRNPFENSLTHQRRYLSGKAWRPAFAGEARELAKALLASDEVDELRSGAFILEAVGTPADAATLTAALDRAVVATKALALEQDIYPRPRGACMELMRAAKMLVDRGASPPTSPRSPGEIALYVAAVGSKTKGRPAGYGRLAASWLDHEIPYVREIVLTGTAMPVPREVEDRLDDVLASDDVDSRIAALRIIEASKATRFRDDVVGVLRGADEEWLIRGAVGAALAVEVPRDQLALALVDRLHERGRTMLFLDLVVSVVLHGPSGNSMSGTPSPSEGRRLQAAWRRFIEDHRESLAAGRQVEAEFSELSPSLFPRGYRLSFPDGRSYPP